MKEKCIAEATERLLAPPSYFSLNVTMNKEGYKDIDTVLKRETR
jgi:hydroxyacylglutathione hydrolase